MNICTLNKIAACGTARFDAAKYTVTEDLSTATGVMVRSAAMHDMELPDSLLAIARAGAGVNNIPVDKCSETGVVVFNTPGANANAVKELVIAGLLISSRKVISGIEWAKTLQGQEGVAKLVEKGKSAFVGPEIKGKRLGVIGLGAIGILVAVLNQLLIRSGREEQGLMVVLAGLVCVLMLMVREISDLFDLIKSLFDF